MSRPLAAIARHVFTTRHWPLGATGAPADGRGWDVVAGALGVAPSELVRARQVHGTSIVVGRPRLDEMPEADILVVIDDSVALGIQVADCVPILIADPLSGAVAAVHAGWRGLASRAPAVAVEALRREYGCKPEDIMAAMGPSIGACCYQVGPDVQERFRDAGHAAHDLPRWFLDAPATSADNPPMPRFEHAWQPAHDRVQQSRDRWFLDTWACARDQLIEKGISPTHIFSAGLCTASHPGLFCSYRRDGRSAGRLAAAIRSGPHRPSPDLRDDRRARSPHA